MFTHCLAQRVRQDEGAVNVRHLNTPYLLLPTSLQLMLKDALSNENSFTNTSLGSVLPLQAQVMACMSWRRAKTHICTHGGLATAVAGRLG